MRGGEIRPLSRKQVELRKKEALLVRLDLPCTEIEMINKLEYSALALIFGNLLEQILADAPVN